MRRSARWAGALLALGIAAAASAEPPSRALLLSDLHFDPLANPAQLGELLSAAPHAWKAILEKGGGTPSAYGSDTNYALLASALREARARLPSPAVVVIAGDLLPHHFRERFEAAAPRGADFQAFAEKTVDFLAGELDAAFPRSPFLLALGNNDSTCGDYCVEPGGSFLTHLGQAWAPLVNRGGRAPGFAKAIAAGGLYTVGLPGSGSGQAVVLNTVLWSTHFTGDARLPAAQLAALHDLLEAPAPGWRWFVAHVPPGFDAFTSAKRAEPTPFLEATAGVRLDTLMTSPPAKATLMITGHSHHASSEIVQGTSPASLPLLSLPSISPIFRNNPAFTVADVDLATGLVAATTTWILPLDRASATWVEEAGCRGGPLDVPSLRTHQGELKPTSVKSEATFMACFATQSTVGAAPEKDWPWYVCANETQSRDGYCLCLAAEHAASGCR
jgi:sphingomyelin phosphodiesterase acid-like 3